MAIQEGYKENLETIVSAAKNGDLCLMECTDIASGETVIVVCAHFVGDDGMHNMVPFAKMFDGDPYEEVAPPDTDAKTA